MSAIDKAYAELAKIERASINTNINEYIQIAHVLALLAIAEELARANDREFKKDMVYSG
jgi:hypothetical protein